MRRLDAKRTAERDGGENPVEAGQLAEGKLPRIRRGVSARAREAAERSTVEQPETTEADFELPLVPHAPVDPETAQTALRIFFNENVDRQNRLLWLKAAVAVVRSKMTAADALERSNQLAERIAERLNDVLLVFPYAKTSIEEELLLNELRLCRGQILASSQMAADQKRGLTFIKSTVADLNHLGSRIADELTDDDGRNLENACRFLFLQAEMVDTFYRFMPTENAVLKTTQGFVAHDELIREIETHQHLALVRGRMDLAYMMAAALRKLQALNLKEAERRAADAHAEMEDACAELHAVNEEVGELRALYSRSAAAASARSPGDILPN